MTITKEEAEQSLTEIQRIIDGTRKSIARSNASPLLMVWGVIWILGYSGTQFYPAQAGWIWMPLATLGGVLSWYLGGRGAPVRRKDDLRIGLFWIVLFFFAVVWAFLLYPFNFARFGAYMGTIPMFAYVVGGLWLGRFFTYLGLSVTLLTILGVLLIPAWLNLWMAMTGGGALLLSGLYIRRYWR